jgi:hypothetical protein
MNPVALIQMISRRREKSMNYEMTLGSICKKEIRGGTG